MVHVFTYHEKFYIYDTGSGSLHECDRATASYLGGATDISDEEMRQAMQDVEALKKEGRTSGI